MVETLYLSEESTIFYYFSVKDRIVTEKVYLYDNSILSIEGSLTCSRIKLIKER